MSIRNVAVKRIRSFSVLLVFIISLNAQGQDTTAQSTPILPTDETIVSSGKQLFENNCTVCHQVHTKLVGPALANVYERRPVEWIKSFISNSQKVIKSGDEYAANLYKEYNNLEMPPHDFNDEELTSILAYIQAETIKGPEVVEQTSTVQGTTIVAEEPVLSSGVITIFLVLLLIVLVLILVVLFMLISVLTKYLKQRAELDEADREIIEQRLDFGKYIRSPAFVWVATFVFVAIVMKTVIDGLYSVGVQQNYAPTQPIAFSHKLHAGEFQIDCNYCHTGVRESKNANIPSANICMNCHTSIKKVRGSEENSVEIAKIDSAIKNNKPIEWIRVHNLPDLAYFNHAQHFNVGGIECQTCHGTVEDMEVVSQFADLTMGWCIDCHRTTDVQSKGNAYYDNLLKIHEKVSKEPMKVEDIGGLECSKCHY